MEKAFSLKCELRRLAYAIIITSIIMMVMFTAIVYNVKTMRLEVDIKDLPVKTSQTIQVAGNELSSGTIGILKYHPKSLFEILIYNEYLHDGAFGLLGLAMILITGLYILWISRTTEKNKLFTKSNHAKLNGLLFLWMAGLGLKMVLMALIRDYFYDSIDHAVNLRFYNPVTTPIFWYIVFFISAIKIVFTIGGKLQSDQELTI